MLEQLIRRMKSPRGQALIEFAFVAPLLFVFLFAIVDFGIALDRRIVLQHAVADGARRGAVDPDIADTIFYTEAESQGLLDTAVNPDAVTVCFTDEDGDDKFGEVGESIVVQANFTYNYTMAFGEILGAFGVSVTGIPMNPAATKRLETAASDSDPDFEQC